MFAIRDLIDHLMARITKPLHVVNEGDSQTGFVEVGREWFQFRQQCDPEGTLVTSFNLVVDADEARKLNVAGDPHPFLRGDVVLPQAAFTIQGAIDDPRRSLRHAIVALRRWMRRVPARDMVADATGKWEPRGKREL